MFASKFGIRTLIAVTHDFVAVAVAWWLAYLFCFNFEVPSASLAIAQEILPWIVFVQAGIFLWMGLYRGLWRYASLPDLKRIFVAVLIGTFGSVAVIVVHGSISQYSRSSHPAGTIVAAIDYGRQSLNLSRLEGTSTV
jgi:FlaA1/EpsC-like NDP-sugar epimerase